MHTSFAKLFSLAVTHEHFGGRGCPDLSVRPDEATARLMGGYRMRLRAETGGAAIFIASRNLRADTLPTEPLVFELIVQDPLVYQYTAMDPAASPDKTVALFDNLQIFRGQTRPDGMLLAKAGEVKPVPVTGKDSDSAAAAALLDRPASAVFALVTVHLGQAASPAVPTGMKVFANGKPQEPRFILPLQARRARWRYLIAGAEDDDVIEASDVVAGKSIGFGEASATEVAGRKALVFETKQAFPVLADPRGAYTAKLVSTNGDERVLPLPSVASLRAEAGSDGMVAEMVALAEKVS